MRTYYHSLAEVLASPLVQTANQYRSTSSNQHRILKSTKLEDAAYRDLRRGDVELEELEKAGSGKLSTFPSLIRDIYQSFYSLNVRKNEPDELSETARRFNGPLLDEVLKGPDYPSIKSACEGRQLPAYEAAGEFVYQISYQLDDLLEKASGSNGTLRTLEKLEKKRNESLEALQQMLKKSEAAGEDNILAKNIVAAANRAQSQCNQAQAVSRMVHDSIMQNQEAVSQLIASAEHEAAITAEKTASVLKAWGQGSETSDPKTQAADLELVARVRKNRTLMEIARRLGRLKEIIDGKRKNGFTYGRGEKYSIELGNQISHALSSEFAMLASPETLPLFLRKVQRKSLKQYQRREPISKGCGDIICMLDESSSAQSDAPWCKAVALALMDIAMNDHRRFAMIHFADIGNFKTDLFLPGQYDREQILQAADTFLDGGTDYATPLREALRLMEEEGFEKADMVFITDGLCELPPDFRADFRKKQQELNFQITGILLDQVSSGFEFSLTPFCTEVLRTSQLSQEQIASQLVTSRAL